MIEEALSYPIRSRRGRRAVLVVAALVVAVAVGIRYAVAFSPTVVALVPAAVGAAAIVLLSGTLSRLLVDDDRSPPAVDRSVIRIGARTVALSAAVLALPTTLLLSTVVAFVDAGAGSTDGVPTLFLVGSTGALFCFVAAGYVLPAAIAASTRTGRLRSALDRHLLVPVLSDTAYVAAWTIGFPLLVVAAAPASVTVRSNDVTGLLSAPLAAYLLLVGTRIVGTGVRRAADRTNRGPDAKIEDRERV